MRVLQELLAFNRRVLEDVWENIDNVMLLKVDNNVRITLSLSLTLHHHQHAKNPRKTYSVRQNQFAAINSRPPKAAGESTPSHL